MLCYVFYVYVCIFSDIRALARAMCILCVCCVYIFSDIRPWLMLFIVYVLCIFSDIRALARAAVEGDEKALDMFTWTPGKGKGNSAFLVGPQEGNTFFIGGKNGILYIFTLEIA